ncbi:hypothetical protein H8356DRAFT_1022952 [Neocallimastix lanati (nom. inval.)]|nr:hypothetical protein H8356DRAFT_1022952 [Neocallimastix sp. JGI-2020a]
MERRSRIVDKKRFENLFSKNKKKKSKDIIDNCLSPSLDHHVLKKNNGILNINNDFGEDFINKILSEKINALNISENDFILSSDNSSNENSSDLRNLSLSDEQEEEHIFFNDTIALKNKVYSSDIATTKNNMAYNTINLNLSQQKTNKINNISFDENDNNLLSDLHGVLKVDNASYNNEIPFSKDKNNSKISLVLEKENNTAEQDQETLNTPSDSFLPNDNIDLLFKKKLNRNSFLDGLNDNNIMSSLSNIKSSNDNSNDKIKNNSENSILNNNKDSLNLTEMDNQNNELINDLKISKSNNSESKNKFDITELDDKTLDYKFDYDIVNSNDINSRINFIKEKYLDFQRSNNHNNKNKKGENNEFKVKQNNQNSKDNRDTQNRNKNKNSQDSQNKQESQEVIGNFEKDKLKIINSTMNDKEIKIELNSVTNGSTNDINLLEEKLNNSEKEKEEENNEKQKIIKNRIENEIFDTIGDFQNVDSKSKLDEMKMNKVDSKSENIELSLNQSNDNQEILINENKINKVEDLNENIKKLENNQYNNSNSDDKLKLKKYLSIHLENIEDKEQDIVNCLDVKYDSDFDFRCELNENVHNDNKKLGKDELNEIDDLNKMEKLKNIKKEKKEKLEKLENIENEKINNLNTIDENKIKEVLENDLNTDEPIMINSDNLVEKLGNIILDETDELNVDDKIGLKELKENEIFEDLIDEKIKLNETEYLEKIVNKLNENDSLEIEKNKHENILNNLEIKTEEHFDILSEDLNNNNDNNNNNNNNKSNIDDDNNKSNINNDNNKSNIDDDNNKSNIDDNNNKSNINDDNNKSNINDDNNKSNINDDNNKSNINDVNIINVNNNEFNNILGKNSTKKTENSSEQNKFSRNELKGSIENQFNIINNESSSSQSQSNHNSINKENRESIPKNFIINCSLFSEIGEDNNSSDFSYEDDKNSDSVITLFEPNLQVDSSDAEYIESDHIVINKDLSNNGKCKDQITYSEEYLEKIISEISKEYEEKIEYEQNKQKIYEENYYKSLSKQELIKDTLDEYELTITQIIEDTNQIKEKNNFQIDNLNNEINRLKRESKIMNITYNELKIHYDQMTSQNKQFIENKQKLQENIDSLQKDVIYANQRYEGLKEHVKSTIKIANDEINKEREHRDKEISIYKAKIMKTQLNNESLEGMYKILLEEYETKVNENNELIQICDSLVENLEDKNKE